MLGAGYLWTSIYPTAVEWANALATFEPHDILGVPAGGARRWTRHRLRARVEDIQPPWRVSSISDPASPPRRAARDVRAGASATVVKRAYRTLSRTAHPDKGGDPARFRLITQAYKALAGDATSRANYRLHGHPDG